MCSPVPSGRLILLATCLFWIIAGAGCRTAQSYVVTLHDGRVYRSAQPPVLDAKTGYYKFRDRYGQDVLLRDREVSGIKKDTKSAG